jgi:3-deoxy-7-phosphoheptulonate synthase
MILIVMQKGATVKETGHVLKHVEELGYRPHLSREDGRTIIAVVEFQTDEAGKFEHLPGVEEVVTTQKPFKLVSREFKSENTVVRVNGVKIGGEDLVVMAGPCSVEDRNQVLETASLVKEAGGKVLRGGAFKPRTSPYSFQGLGEKGLEILADVREKVGLPIVTECLSPGLLPKVAQVADIIQIGARNMQNFALLEEVGRLNKPVLLKRGMMSTVEELLMSAEYILSQGNYNVILCERGIRTFEKATRNTLDVSAVPVVKEWSHLPIIADPSHATGVRNFVPSAARASVAAGADGLLVEIHPHPEKALSDGFQCLNFSEFRDMMNQVNEISETVKKYKT